MKYLLVLQWPASSVDDYDNMIAVEDSLIEGLPKDSEVDGHDGGASQVNIFIRTDNPIKTFEDVRGIIEDFDSWRDIRVAYRDIEREEFAILWPVNLKELGIL